MYLVLIAGTRVPDETACGPCCACTGGPCTAVVIGALGGIEASGPCTAVVIGALGGIEASEAAEAAFQAASAWALAKLAADSAWAFAADSARIFS